MQIGSVNLPDGFIWVDEFTYTKVAQKLDYAINGALIAQESQKLKGRTITLAGNVDGFQRVWLSLQELTDLYALSEQANITHTLTLPDLRTFSVRFNRDGGTPIKARQLFVGDSDTWVVEEIKLIEV